MLTLWRSTTGGPFSEEVGRKKKRPIGQEVDIIFRPGEKLYSKALKRSHWQTQSPDLRFFSFSKWIFARASSSSLPLLSHIPYLLAPPPQKNTTHFNRDCIKINSHNPRSWRQKEKKGGKSNTLPFPSATQLSATSLWLSPRLSRKWRHTHTHTLSYKRTKKHSVTVTSGERGRC